MARIDHTSCTHPRTPAGRAACRRTTGVEAPTTAPAAPYVVPRGVPVVMVCTDGHRLVWRDSHYKHTGSVTSCRQPAWHVVPVNS